MNAVELGRMEVRQNNDDKDMARLGKNPVLKVWRPTYFYRPYFFFYFFFFFFLFLF